MVVFAYEHRYRVLDQFHVKTSAAGNDLLVGVDPDKGEWRSFRVDRIQGGVRIVGQSQAARRDGSSRAGTGAGAGEEDRVRTIPGQAG